MLLIPDAQYRRACYVIDTSGFADQLEATMSKAKQGRPGQLPLRSYLIGAYLAIEEKASFKNTTILEVLIQGLSIEAQWELKARYRNSDGQVCIIGRHHLDYHTRWLPKRLSYTLEAATKWGLELDDDEMLRRRTGLRAASDALLDASIVDPSGDWVSLDGSGTWSWGKSRRRVHDPENIRSQEHTHGDEQEEPEPGDLTEANGPREPEGPNDADVPAGNEDGDTLERVRDEVADGESDLLDDVGGCDLLDAGGTVKPNFDPEASFGSKTSKSGKTESFYGYMLDAAVAIPKPGGEKRPVVLRRLVVSPASTDVVEPTLSILDSLLATDVGVSNIVVDRHYSYKEVTRWADELRARDISQHFDLRKDEHGFKDVDGMRMAGGWMHCPATPDELGTVERPGPGASREAVEEFRARIAERLSWAMSRHEDITSEGRTRWMCPAMAGTRGCPLREGTVEVAREAGLPIVADPPAADTAPKCCTQKTVSTQIPEMRKHQQPHYWGSPEWQKAYDLRTYVEGLFGSLKNPDTERVSRGFTKFPGLVMMTIGLTLAGVVCNVRHQRRFWEARQDRPDHPLLTPDPEFLGWREVSDDEVDQSEPDTETPAA